MADMDLDYNAFGFWMHVVELLFIAILGAYSWVANRDKANTSSIKLLDQGLTQIDDRLIRAETELKHVPGDEVIATIHRRIDDIAQGLTRLDGTMVAMNTTMQLLHKYLLNRG